MKYANLPKEPVIAIIVVASIAAVVAIVLGSIFLHRSKVKRQVYELRRNFEHLHAILITQDAQYIKRLENISRTNLLYVDTHTKFLKRFKEIRDKHDAYAQGQVNRLKDMFDDRKYKLIKESLPRVKDAVKELETEVNGLNSDLLLVVKPEEEARQSSLSLKENLRRIRQDYYAKQGDLGLVNESFSEVFNYIDKLFTEFDDYVESAQYDDANEVLPKIKTILLELSNSIIELPDLCALVTSVIPDKLISLENAYEGMEKENYPLHHLGVNQTCKNIKVEITRLTTKIKRFDLNGVHARLDEISTSMDQFFISFENEKVAREEFETNNEKVYSTVNTIERRYIKICNLIPEVEKVFVFNPKYVEKITNIKTNVNMLGALKRSLDTFVHSATKQPYSVLVAKMKDLDAASKTIIVELDEINNYMNSLKADTEKAYNKIYTCYQEIKDGENQLDKMNMEIMNAKYKEQIDTLYSLLNKLNELVHKSPINVDEVNENRKELEALAEPILKDGQIKADFINMQEAEQYILYANRHRTHLSEVEDKMHQADTYFSNGNFKEATNIAKQVIEQTNINERK